MNLLDPLRKLKKTPVVMAFIIVYTTLTPSVALALGTGPGQPELEAFSPIGMNDMVDPFTGDFSYNLPLLNVPGPGGGYPINLTYSAGVTMEQEASWVGLGWNLSPGSVSRELRGVPDDLKGQNVTKEMNMKPNQTFGAGVSTANIEALGANFGKGLGLDVGANLMLTYNNYSGFDAKFGLGFSLTDAKAQSSSQSADPDSEPVVDTASGGTSVTKSDADKKEENLAKDEVKNTFANPSQVYGSYLKNVGAGKASSALRTLTSPFVHDINYLNPVVTSSYSLNVKTGIDLFGVTGDLTFNAFYSEQKIDKDFQSRKVPAYGYLYSEDNPSSTGAGIMDFTMSNSSKLNDNTKYLPIPNHTYDIYHIKAQGVSGAVRAYKGGVTELFDAAVTSKRKNVGGGGELNSSGGSTKGGVNVNAGYGNSYVGPWTSGRDGLSFLESWPGEGEISKEFEPYYFKFSGELTSRTNTNTIHGDDKAARFNLSLKASEKGVEPKINADLQGAAINALTENNAYKKKREKRAKVLQMLTEEESKNLDGNYLRKISPVPSGSPENANNYATTGANKDRIGSVRVVNEDGRKFVFGIAAKNKKFKQSTFSIGAKYGNTLGNLIKTTVPYNSKDNSTSNEKGTDHFYSGTTTPEYAHSFLLTEILSEDYRDLGTIAGGSYGPSPDDFGTYVKFDYNIRKDFKTKSPASGANYLPGDLSNNGDDKATISYFEKDLYYLKSVQTKTHIAIFELDIANPREDAYGVLNQNSSPSSTQKQYRLKKISLYELDDYNSPGSPEPIKTVNFGYSYSLCPGSPNADDGKLTLDSVWFSVGNEKTKMSLSPYKFSYDPATNYPYSAEKIDRWSTYQEQSTNTFGSNVLYPYTAQGQRELSDEYAGAWNLSSITLPTGGVIDIEYESDDYQYVQDQQAQSMYRIVGFSPNSNGSGYDDDLGDNDLYMVVELPNGEKVAKSEVSKYTEGIRDAYFKVFVKMKGFASSKLKPKNTPFASDAVTDKAYDFVDGYVNFQGAPTTFNNDDESNWIVVKVKKLGGDHPVKKQGWLDLQTARNDLMDESGFDLDVIRGLSSSALPIIGDIVGGALADLIDNNSFFTNARLKGWCNEMETGAINGIALSSIVRLNKPERKIGGGHRVKAIEINDQWGEMNGGQNTAYGQHYTYVLEDGTSSGVAAYEPLTGGEENPLKRPFRYSSKEFVFKNNNLYTEMPLGEEFFPAASVGYSRVLIENKANVDRTIAGEAIVEKCYYTAKDYPMQVEATGMKKVNTELKNRLTEFIGVKYYFQPGFSQGYVVKTNDMHGKPKSEATYYADRGISKSPYQKSTYIYKTKGGYGEQKANVLDNQVKVFYGDGDARLSEVGIDKDTYVLLRESSVWSISGDFDGNLEYIVPWWVIPTVFPTIDNSYTMTRIATMTKVVSQNGILEKVVSEKAGAQTEVENLAFDHDTGEPVVHSITNEFGDKKYRYNQFAKWYYPQMQGAYQNIGMILTGNVSANKDYLQPGDVLMNDSGTKAWVDETGSGDLIVYNAAGTSVVNLSGYKVIESGYGNNLRAKSGFIESISDPTAPNSVTKPLPVFSAYNSATKTGTNTFDMAFIQDCMNNTRWDHEVSYGLSEITGGDDCVVTMKRYEGTAPPNIGNYNASKDVYEIWEYTQVEPNAYEEKYSICRNGYFDQEINFHGMNPGSPYASCLGTDGLHVKLQHIPMENNVEDYDLYYAGGDKIYGKYPDGTTVDGIILGNISGALPDCFITCLDGVLNSEAYRYADDLKTEDYVPSAVTSQPGWSVNPYRFGYKGIYKQNKTMIYPENRTQMGPSSITTTGPHYPTHLFEDGQFFAYYWNTPDNVSPGKWEVINEVTKFDQNGIAIEEKDAIGNFSSAIYGHERALPLMMAQNAQVSEIAYDGFEDYGGTYSASRRDNQLNLGSGVLLIKDDAHTGEYSIKVTSASFTPVSLNTGMSLINGKKYIVQAWHKVGSQGTLTINNGSGATAAEVKSANIEGWELVEHVFTAGASNTIGFTGQNSQFDDIKIQPFNAASKTYVYDSHTHKLVAQLDENHFATIYNYDRDQILVQVKKETNRGIKTIQSSQRVTQAN